MRIGERVRHRIHGDGVVVGLSVAGVCEVNFRNFIRHVHANNLRSLDAAKLAERDRRQKLEAIARSEQNSKALARQKQMRIEVLGHLKNGAIEEADAIFEKRCADWWGRADYEQQREAAVRELQEVERQKLKDEVLQHLKAGCIEDADRHFNKECLGWWERSDYEKYRLRAVAINEFVGAYQSSSLTQLNELLADERLELSSEEIATLKLPKIDTYLTRRGISLDPEQRHACARPEQSLLIRARAGSGKTHTLASVAALAIEDEKLDPDQVMILAFNKMAADEIGERVRSTSGVAEYRNARTFHSLAYQLAAHQGRSLVFDDGNLQPSRRKQSQFLERVIHSVLNPAFREKLYEFFRWEIEQIDRIGSNLVGEEYLAFRRSITDYSLGGDSVKSNGEKFIADFLFEHGINYKYEKAWSSRPSDSLQGAAYRPDFSLLVGDRDLIWEHWAIDPDNPDAKVPEWWKTSTQDYRDQIEVKRHFWRQRNIHLIETHADMLREGREAFERRLQRVLGEHGIELRKLDHADLVKRVAEAPRTISRLTGLFLGFISRAKKRGWDVKQTASMIAENSDTEPRNRVFHELAVRAYAEYEKLLVKEWSWDFDDLLISATEQAQEHGRFAEIKLGPKRYIKLGDLRWILIDEFQDFSELYHRLIRVILDANPGIRVVAVGDDWQAINGFAGAQLSFFENFNAHFDNAGTANVSTNYRSDRAIVGAGNKVMRGYGQIARAFSAWVGDIQAKDIKNVWVNADDHVGSLCLDAASDANGRVDYELAKAVKICTDFIVDSVFEQDGGRWLPNVLILARTNRSYGLKHEAMKERLLSVLEQHPRLRDIGNDIQLEVLTAHKAKGKEAHTVIVLEATAKQFPKIHADNQLFGPFGVTAEDTLAEERRLFYVAVTRAKQRLLLLTEAGSESSFLEELGLVNGIDHLAMNIPKGDLFGVQLGEVGCLIKDRLERIG